MESNVEPIKMRVTGEDQRVLITQPEGFDFKSAEMGNTVTFRVQLAAPLKFEHENCYAQLAPHRLEWPLEANTFCRATVCAPYSRHAARMMPS